MFKKILVPTDGSLLSEKCIQAAVKFSASLGAKMVAIPAAFKAGIDLANQP